jgi:hypothetical protein
MLFYNLQGTKNLPCIFQFLKLTIMHIGKKIFNPLFVAGVAFAFFSCNNSADTAKADAKTDTTKAADTVAAAVPPPPPPAAFVPFDVAEMSHTVKDYSKWRPVFDADSVSRKESGMKTLVVAKGLEKKNDIFMAFEIADLQKAKDFSTNPKLKVKLHTAGVISKPAINFFHVIRFNPDTKEKQWVMVTHKVKDFVAWLKVYDGEGKEKRASEGMVDVLLSRSTSDSNIVQIVFDITDLAKAKAAITSEDKKKLMMSAGVMGKPKIEFYETADK